MRVCQLQLLTFLNRHAKTLGSYEGPGNVRRGWVGKRWVSAL